MKLSIIQTAYCEVEIYGIVVRKIYNMLYTYVIFKCLIAYVVTFSPFRMVMCVFMFTVIVYSSQM